MRDAESEFEKWGGTFSRCQGVKIDGSWGSWWLAERCREGTRAGWWLWLDEWQAGGGMRMEGSCGTINNQSNGVKGAMCKLRSTVEVTPQTNSIQVTRYFVMLILNRQMDEYKVVLWSSALHWTHHRNGSFFESFFKIKIPSSRLQLQTSSYCFAITCHAEHRDNVLPCLFYKVNVRDNLIFTIQWLSISCDGLSLTLPRFY